MYYQKQLDCIYDKIDDFKSDLFCRPKISEKDIIDDTVEFLLGSVGNCICDCCNNKCIYNQGILGELLDILACIKRDTNCGIECEYFSNIEQLRYLIKKLEKLLCSLENHNITSCKYIAEIICILTNILEILLDVISNIKNIECICKSCICCKQQILYCWLCMLYNQADSLEKNIDYLQEILYFTSKSCDGCKGKPYDGCGGCGLQRCSKKNIW